MCPRLLSNAFGSSYPYGTHMRLKFWRQDAGRAYATRAELAQLQQEWESTLNKLSTWFARHAKREARDLDRLLTEQPQQLPQVAPTSRAELKASLRRSVRTGEPPPQVAPPPLEEESG